MKTYFLFICFLIYDLFLSVFSKEYRQEWDKATLEAGYIPDSENGYRKI